jgi:hypothetical protein
MNRKIIIVIVFWIILYFIIFQLIPYYNNKYAGCSLHKEVYTQFINSTITRKFIDSNEHANPTISYNKEDGTEQSMVLYGEFDGMFDYISVGDSILKKKNSLFYIIKSKVTRKDSIFKFDSVCKDSIKKQK